MKVPRKRSRFQGDYLGDAFNYDDYKLDYDRKVREGAIPLIAGYTYNTVGANSEADARAGYKRWLSMSPEERFEKSALGAALDFNPQINNRTGKPYSEMSGAEFAADPQRSYWAQLAGNVMRGGATPKANVPHGVVGVEGEAPIGQTGAHAYSDAPASGYDRFGVPLNTQASQRPLEWSEMSRADQERIASAAERAGVSIEEMLVSLRGRGWTGRN